MTGEDSVRIEGRGGLYHGESFSLAPGKSATFGRGELATHPATRTRLWRRLPEAERPGSLLEAMAAEHLRLLYLGAGRLFVERLEEPEVRVGHRPVAEPLEVDLDRGGVEIAFGFGERLVARRPGAPDALQELAPPPPPPDPLLRLLPDRATDRPPESYPLESEPAAAEPARVAPAPPPPGSERGSGPRRRRLRSAPAIALSVLLHVVVILGLFSWLAGAIVFERPLTTEVTVKPPEARIAPAEPPAPEDRASTENPSDEELPAPATLLESETLAESSVSEMPTGDLPAAAGQAPVSGTPGVIGPGVGSLAGLSTGGGGGGARSERPGRGPVAAGLAWLANHQLEDGSFRGRRSLAACGSCRSRGKRDYPVALTALSTLGFVGSGNTHRRGPYRDAVRRALRWLTARSEAGGAFHPAGTPEEEREVYGEAMAALALAEVHRHEPSPLLVGPLTRAVRHLLAIQEPWAGWRYTRRSTDSDTSVTGWVVLALHAARRAGIDVSPAGFTGAREWFAKMTAPPTFRVGYSRRGHGSFAMTAEAAAARLLMGDEARDPELRAARSLLLAQPPAWEASGVKAGAPGGPDLYYWYFGTLAAARFGGLVERRWGRALREALLPHQATSGHEEGSWPPEGRWDRVGGRVFSTALAVLSLEVTEGFRAAFK